LSYQRCLQGVRQDAFALHASNALKKIGWAGNDHYGIGGLAGGIEPE